MRNACDPASTSTHPASGWERELLDASPQAILTINRHWTITYLNPAALKMLAPSGSPLHKNQWKHYPHTTSPDSPWVKSFHRAMDERTGSEFEGFYPEPLNLWVHHSVDPVLDGIVVFFRDISHERKLTEALLNNERVASVGRLASSIAHEIQNPLESVANLLFLAQGASNLGEVAAYLETADRELRRAAAITRQTLRFNRQSEDGTSLYCDQLVRDVLVLQHARILNASTDVDSSRMAQLSIHCNEGEIRQILNNLITNAIDAMPERGGRLTLRTRQSRRHGVSGAIITVADTGGGMSSGTLHQSFEAFFTTKGSKGNGLGLWISRQIAERHGGTLKARSSQRKQHHGSVFQLFLPLAAKGGKAEMQSGIPA